MMKNLNIDKLTKDILKNSYLELTNPDFSIKTMKRIVRADRRRRVLENILFCFLVFAAVDALILLGLWLTGLDPLDVAVRLGDVPHMMLAHAEKLENSIIGNAFIKYIMMSIGGVMVILMIIESRLKSVGMQKLKG